ncbi:MAG: helix-turn-helix domain-containing protein, partial [Phaeodactylibacter sp.]|nr:helix-turn-helix domain-containing protein [Phaeodactylibacter sp.]
MGKPIPYDFRAKIAQRKQSGDSYMDIALDLGLSESAVKKIWYKYLKEGESAFHTKHNNCGRTSP